MLVIASIVAISIFGLNLGIDFTGGSMMDIKFINVDRPSISDLQNALSEVGLKDMIIQPLERGLKQVK